MRYIHRIGNENQELSKIICENSKAVPLTSFLKNKYPTCISDIFDYFPAIELFSQKNYRSIMRSVVGNEDFILKNKYISSSIYIFETPSFYILCECDLPEGTAMWRYMQKTRKFQTAVFDLKHSEFVELANFFREFYWHLIRKLPDISNHIKDQINDELHFLQLEKEFNHQSA